MSTTANQAGAIIRTVHDARVPGTSLKAVKLGDLVIMNSGLYRVVNNGQRYQFWGVEGDEAEDYRQTVDDFLAGTGRM